MTNAVNPSHFTLRTQEYRALPIPSLPGAKIGDCFVAVTDLPAALSEYMEVNPRVPNRNKKDILAGPVIKGIRNTLLDTPEDMAIKNQGIYLLVEDADFSKTAGGIGQLKIKLSDPALHGIVNGGHTFAAIQDELTRAIENSNELAMGALDRAYVRLHVMQGVPADKVVEIAEGLNRSKQVDDPSLEHLKGAFDRIQEVMKGKPGAEEISYQQGGAGDIYVTDLLVALEMFNCGRFDSKRHPQNLLNRSKSALEYFSRDAEVTPSPNDLLVPRLPEILRLLDEIKEATPTAAKRIFDFGRMKLGSGKERAGSEKHKGNVPLPFLGKTMDHNVPNAWAYPMLAAFRANVRWDPPAGKFEWKVPLRELLPQVIDDLVQVCVASRPDKSKAESVYDQCYTKVENGILRRQLGVVA